MGNAIKCLLNLLMAALLIWLLLVFGASPALSASPCPIDFAYVRDFFPSACKSSPPTPSSECCEAAFNLFGLAIAIYLRDFKAFEFPDNSTVFSCFSAYEASLHRNGLEGFSVLSSCPSTFDASLFITSPYLCSGIQSAADWETLVGPTPMDSSCKGDLSTPAACQVCASDVHNAIFIASNLSANHSACFYYGVLYAAAIVNEFGPTNPATAGCLLASKATPSSSAKSHHIAMYASIGAILVVLLGCVVVISIWLWLRRQRQLYHENFIKRNRKLIGNTIQPNVGAIWYKIEDIKIATNNFAPQKLIGEGGFATVYKGVMPDGSQVAVKKIKNCTPEGDLEFRNEVEVINCIRHRNLVALRGCCVASNTNFGHLRLLIYDCMLNGSLEEYLFSGKKPVLSWPDRQKIALDAAKGIAYLHTSVEPPIIHRDIKANNILLDENLNAHVADFGLAKVTTEGMTHMTTRVAGTQGYLAPEYALYGQLTEKSDVYSFGVLLLVLMSGRAALDVHDAYPLITDWAWVRAKRNSSLEIVDERIRSLGSPELMERYVLVGILCAHLLVAFRPTMSQALKMLEGDMDVPEIPDRPLPLTHEGLYTFNDCSSFSPMHKPIEPCSYKSEDLLR
ncbi:hypothetical protein GOP47_0020344 [Adiantum capillus-veneris]|uniref:non-specific serine/threonine protein kinase n=1 Tax=Adiantum capillus-veneris TaxID=13818 RepID=A0A9D4Z8L1_ADICA|nr:hypothetical protein GOP47_0020344 [Adiantum capillus-veneris]